MKNSAGYQFSASVKDSVLEIVFAGEVTKNTIEQLHVEVLATIADKAVNALLCDVSALEWHDDFAAAYFRTRSFPVELLKLPSAIVDPAPDSEYLSFYETTAANVGHRIKWFADIKSARAWLKSKA